MPGIQAGSSYVTKQSILDGLAQVPGAVDSGVVAFAEQILQNASDEFVSGVVDAKAGEAQKRDQLAGATQGVTPRWVELAKWLKDYKDSLASGSGTPSVDSIRATDGARLKGDIAQVYAAAGLNNNATAPKVVDAKGMTKFVKSLLKELGDVDSSFKKLARLDFAEKKGNLNKVLLRGWPKDLYKVYTAFQKLPKNKQVQAARIILNYTTEYFGLDFENFRQDLPTNPLKPFSFADFTLDTFINGAVKKGHLTPKTALNQIVGANAKKELELTPQGEKFIAVLLECFSTETTLEQVFEQLHKIEIVQPDASQDYPLLVGDGLSGEQGAHFVASADARYYNIAAPDVTRDASMVTAAYRYLKLFKEAQANPFAAFASQQNLYVQAGKLFVGAANVAAPLSFAQTLRQVISGAAIYFSLAYALRIEVTAVLGGAIAAQALGDKIAGVLRLQSPTTMHAKKNDLTPKQGFAYAFAQWIKDLAALVEADNEKHTSNHVWPIVRTFSVEQNRSFRQLIEHVNAHTDRYGIRFATAVEGGEGIHKPLNELIDAIKKAARNTDKLVLTDDHTEGLRTHKNVTMTIIAKAMAAIAFEGIFSAKTGQKRVADASKKAAPNLWSSEETYANVDQLLTVLKQNAGMLSLHLGQNGAETIVNKGTDGLEEAGYVADARSWLFGSFALARKISQAGGSFPLFILEEVKKSNPNPTKYYTRNNFEGQIVEMGLLEPSTGGRFGFRYVLSTDPLKEGDTGYEELAGVDVKPKFEMFIRSPVNHPGPEIVIPYEIDVDYQNSQGHLQTALVAQVSPAVAGQSIGYSENVAPIQQQEFFDKAWKELGLKVADSVTGLSQNVVGQILKILAKPELGFDLSSLTIDSLTFKGNAQGPRADYLQSFVIDSKSAGEKTDVKGKTVTGEFVDGRVVTKDVEGNTVNEVVARLFIKGNTTEGEPQKMQQPSAKRLSPNGVGLNFTVMGADLWKKFVDLGGDPNVIHTIDLAGTATGAKGAFAPGFGLAAQIETKLRQKFGALVDELSLTLFGRMGPGMSYDMRINPTSKTEPHFEFQVVKPGNRKKKKDDEVVMAGTFKLQTPKITLVTEVPNTSDTLPEAPAAEAGFIAGAADMAGLPAGVVPAMVKPVAPAF